jgi:hypothetical protein
MLTAHPRLRLSASRSFRAARQGPGVAADARDPEAAGTAVGLPGCDAAADERLLAWGRLAASSALLIRLITDTGPGHSDISQTIAAAYTGYSFLIVLVSWWRCQWLLRRVKALHAIDFAWTTAASAVGGGTGSHAFIFFAFILAAAAFRWDLKRTLLDGALILTIGIVEHIVDTTGLTPWACTARAIRRRPSHHWSAASPARGACATGSRRRWPRSPGR